MSKYLFVFAYTRYHESVIREIDFELFFPGYSIIEFSSGNCSEKGASFFLRIKLIWFFFYCRYFILPRAHVEVLAPHPDQLLTNYFFYEKKVKAVHLYEDGLLNYLSSSLTGEYLKRSMKRRLYSKFLFYAFNVVDGHVSGVEGKRIGKGFFHYPEMVYGSENIQELVPLDNHRKVLVNRSKNVALFVDQNIEGVLGREAVEVRRKVYEKLKGFQVVYFKKHHDVLVEYEEVLNVPDNFVLLDDGLQGEMAESLVEILDCGSVVSFYSTALINIASRYEGVQCFCFPVSTNLVLTKFGELGYEEFFSRFGVLSLYKL